MIESDARAITYRGAPARLTVMRNDGHCWGRIVVGDQKFDVTTRRDLYDRTDEEALDAFERASRNPRCVEPAQGWL